MDVAECEAEGAEEAVGEAGGEVLDGEGRGGEAHGLLFVCEVPYPFAVGADCSGQGCFGVLDQCVLQLGPVGGRGWGKWWVEADGCRSGSITAASLTIKPVETISETWRTSTSCGCGPQGQGVAWTMHPDRARWA